MATLPYPRPSFLEEADDESAAHQPATTNPKNVASSSVEHLAIAQNVGGSAGGDAGMSMEDRRRNILGYHGCRNCYIRKIRCLPAPDDPQKRCSNCIRLKKECTFFPVRQQSHMERTPRTVSTSEMKVDRVSNSSSESSAQVNSYDDSYRGDSQGSVSSLGQYFEEAQGIPLADVNEDLKSSVMPYQTGKDDWETHRTMIQELYVHQGKTLSEVIRQVSEEKNFQATIRSYRSRIKEWGFLKPANLSDRAFKTPEILLDINPESAKIMHRPTEKLIPSSSPEHTIQQREIEYNVPTYQPDQDSESDQSQSSDDDARGHLLSTINGDVGLSALSDTSSPLPSPHLPPDLDEDDDLLRPSVLISRQNKVKADVLSGFSKRQANDFYSTLSFVEDVKQPQGDPLRRSSQTSHMDSKWGSILSLNLDLASLSKICGRNVSSKRFEKMPLIEILLLYEEKEHHTGLNSREAAGTRPADRGRFTSSRPETRCYRSPSSSPALDSDFAKEARINSILETDDVYRPLSFLYRKSLPAAYICKLLECRNVLLTLYEEIETMQKSHLCSDVINLFVYDRVGVIRLQRLELNKIFDLILCLNGIVRALVWGLTQSLAPLDRQALERLPQLPIRDCAALFSLDALEKVALSDHINSFEEYVARWLAIAETIDLAVLSYCGAHLDPDLGQTVRPRLQNNIRSISLYSGTLSMVQVSLACLDPFLKGQMVWVFHSCFDNISEINGAFLSTNIEDLADIWGPVWKLHEEPVSNLNNESKCWYNLGSGIIVGWPRNIDGTGPEPLVDEAFCHFLPSTQEVGSNRLIDTGTYSRLLIGAKMDMTLNENTCSTTQRQGLVGLKAQPYGTSKKSVYKDSEILQIQAGHSGVQVGYAASYKIRPGTTRKDRILWRWRMEPEKRNPRLLLLWCGLEVSLCTRNARRRRLVDLMGSKTISSYLETARFEWADPTCQCEFRKALLSDDPSEFVRLYDNNMGWRRDLGRAVSWFFDALEHTGITPEGDLATYCMVGDSDDPDYTTIFPRKQQNWSSFLKDTTTTATFSVSTDTCLAFSKSPGQQCRQCASPHPQHTILQTAVVPVSMTETPISSRWSRHVQEGQYLSLEAAPSHRLKVISRLRKGKLLVQWSDRGYIRAGAKKLLGSGPTTIYLREQMEDIGIDDNRPVKIFVVSKCKNNLPRRKAGILPRQSTQLSYKENIFQSQECETIIEEPHKVEQQDEVQQSILYAQNPFHEGFPKYRRRGSLPNSTNSPPCQGLLVSQAVTDETLEDKDKNVEPGNLASDTKQLSRHSLQIKHSLGCATTSLHPKVTEPESIQKLAQGEPVVESHLRIKSTNQDNPLSFIHTPAKRNPEPDRHHKSAKRQNLPRDKAEKELIYSMSVSSVS